MPDKNLKKGWTEIITANDLDAHMIATQQVQANARLIKKMLTDFHFKKNAKLIIPGCGTGQLFDYFDPKLIINYQLTFTDINPNFLTELKKRLKKLPLNKYASKRDDIEKTKLKANFDGVLAVLLLEHINWQKGIKSIVGYNPKKIFLIIQEQSANKTIITPKRTLKSSIKRFTDMATPHHINRVELIKYLNERGYGAVSIYKKLVPDNKTMTGLVFEKNYIR